MTPEQMKTHNDQQERMQARIQRANALETAKQRAKEGASLDSILKDAERIVAFINGDAKN
jgi:hypothetical protein